MPESQQPSASLSVGLALRVEGAAHSVEIVEQAVMAERHGWDGVCLSASSNSSGSVLLTATAVAAQTEKLRLGVELLPDATLHPLRLGEGGGRCCHHCRGKGNGDAGGIGAGGI